MATKTRATPKPKAKATSAGRRRSTTATKRKVVRAPKPASPAETVIEVPQEEAPKPEPVRLKRPDLIEAVTSRVALKRSDVKDVLDAVLAELGNALDSADEVVVPPLGKLMVKRRPAPDGNRVLTLKLKRSEPNKSDTASPLAPEGEDG